jgi:hypothetical protein
MPEARSKREIFISLTHTDSGERRCSALPANPILKLAQGNDMILATLSKIPVAVEPRPSCHPFFACLQEPTPARRLNTLRISSASLHDPPVRPHSFWSFSHFVAACTHRQHGSTTGHRRRTTRPSGSEWLQEAGM